MTAHRRRRAPLVMMVAILAILLGTVPVGCARSQTPAPQPQPTQPVQPTTPSVTPSPTPPSAEPTTAPSYRIKNPLAVRVYLVRGEKLGVAGRVLPAGTGGVAAATIRELLQAPTAGDKRYGLATAIPKGTRYQGLSIQNGVATIGLSKEFESGGGSLSMQLRVAQVVGTLTQFPTVKRVAFKIEGRRVASIGGEGISVSPPVMLGDFENVLPPILVEGPTPGETIGRVFRLFGTANVFEAQFNMRLTQGGNQLVAKSVKASSGTGTRGTFSAAVTYSGGQAGPAVLEVFDISEKDGSRVDLVRIPLRLK